MRIGEKASCLFRPYEARKEMMETKAIPAFCMFVFACIVADAPKKYEGVGWDEVESGVQYPF